MIKLETKFSKIGNSYAIFIPKIWVESLKDGKDSKLLLKLLDNRIEVEVIEDGDTRKD